jgi:hypothetical protein
MKAVTESKGTHTNIPVHDHGEAAFSDRGICYEQRV